MNVPVRHNAFCLEADAARYVLAKRRKLLPDVKARLQRLIAGPALISLEDSCALPTKLSEWNALASALVGVSSPRTSFVYCSPDRHGIYSAFPPLKPRSRWTEDCANAIKLSTSPLAAAAVIYGCLTLHHPYPDGNGRLARAAALLSLRRSLNAPDLDLPMATSFILHRPAVTIELRRLSQSGDWHRFSHFFSQLLTHSALICGRIDR